ncbi:MAG: beta-propeller fold lactonase family protein [Nitrospira defluvii]|nr:beta-propeller fold lactonase family protein [Nitrospira defluvii]
MKCGISVRAVLIVLWITATLSGCGRPSETGRQYAYVTNAKDGTVSMLSVDPGTGALKFLGTVPAGTTPSAAAIDQAGRFLFVPNAGSNNVSVFAINPKTGMLTPVQGGPMPSGWGPDAVLMPASERFAYVVNRQSNNVSAFEIGGASGLLMEVTGSPFQLAGLRGAYKAALDSSGRFAYVSSLTEDQIAAFAVDGTTGTWTPLEEASYRVPQHPGTIVVHPSGRFAYVASNGGVWAYQIDRATGSLQGIDGSPFPGGGVGTLVSEPSGKFLVGGAYTSVVFLYEVDLINGGLKVLGGPSTILKPISSMAVDASGRFVYVTHLESDQVFVFKREEGKGLKPIPGSPFAVIKGARSAAAKPVSGEASFTYETGGTWITVTPRYH